MLGILVRLNDLSSLREQIQGLKEDCCESADAYLTDEELAKVASEQFDVLSDTLKGCQIDLCFQLGRACLLKKKVQMGTVLNLFTIDFVEPDQGEKRKKQVFKNPELLSTILEQVLSFAKEAKRGLTWDDNDFDVESYRLILSNIYENCVEAYI